MIWHLLAGLLLRGCAILCAAAGAGLLDSLLRLWHCACLLLHWQPVLGCSWVLRRPQPTTSRLCIVTVKAFY